MYKKNNIRIGILQCGIGGFPLGAIMANVDLVGMMDDNKLTLELLKKNFKNNKIYEVQNECPFHPDAIMIEGLAKNWTKNICISITPRIICSEGDNLEWLSGYNKYNDILDCQDFGLPQIRKRSYTVAFRSDIIPLFHYFPFPDATNKNAILSDFLDKNRTDLLFSKKALEGVARREENNRKRGFRYKSKVISINSKIPQLLPQYSINKTMFLIDSPEGKRRLSANEAKTIMGFPKDWILPESENKSFQLLGNSVCPPVAQEIIKELEIWVF